MHDLAACGGRKCGRNTALRGTRLPLRGQGRKLLSTGPLGVHLWETAGVRGGEFELRFPAAQNHRSHKRNLELPGIRILLAVRLRLLDKRRHAVVELLEALV